MIKKPTVFVVGAGASKELDFPLGSELLEQIAKDVDFYIEAGEVQRGTPRIWREIINRADGPVDRHAYFVAARQVAEAAHLGISIDNIVHQLADDFRVGECAKLAIALRLIFAEQSSPLAVHADPRRVTWPKAKGTWLGRFAQALVQDFQRNELERIFENVSVISFNYDRTIRRFLPLALQSQFALSEKDAEALAAKLNIIHPYGNLGRLPWQPPTSSTDQAIPFGDSGPSLWHMAAGIRTFTEQSSDPLAMHALRDIMSNAYRVVFLGFGYLPQNMQLLLEDLRPNARSVLGTALNLSTSDIEIVRGQLEVLFPETHRPYKEATLVDLGCSDFLSQHFRTITD